MNQVPVIGKPIVARILTHRRDDNAVAQRDPTQLQRREEMSRFTHVPGTIAVRPAKEIKKRKVSPKYYR
jgi:hypothetical protein